MSFFFRLIHGVGDALIFVIFFLGIFRLFRIERMGGNTGLMNMTTMLGMVAGSLIYSPIGESYGYGVPIWISGVLTLLLIPPLLLKRFNRSMSS